jgi:uncharacterized protein (DUF1330 family)
MEVKNTVLPNEEQIKGFFDAGAPGPIYMVNLLKFNEKAEYADGRKTQLTGAQAYQVYAEGVSVLLQEFGGYAAFFADVQRLMLGEVEELWDEVAIAVYPSRQAMLDMMQSDTMKDISQHRAAGLAGQLNIETTGASGTWLKKNTA